MDVPDGPPSPYGHGLVAARLAVSDFTRTRFSIMELLDDEDVVVKSQLKKLRELLTADMEKATSAMEMLHASLKDDEQDALQVEMDKLLSSYSDTLEAAQNYGLRDTFSVHSDEVRAKAACVDVSSSPNRIEQDMWRQLERVSITVFAGNKQKYENWKAAFIACIDKSPLSAEYKLLQLRQYLSGDALKAIENLGHSAASYEAAKDRLDQKFGGLRRHIVAQMKEIDNFKPIQAANAGDIDKFADLVNIVVINLKESHRSEELGYGSLYFKLLKKLPESMIKSFRRWIFENRRVENVESLKDWINQESQFQTIACETERTVFIVF